MLAFAAALFLTAVTGLPTEAPLLAIIPPGANVNVSLGDPSRQSSILVFNPKNENLYHKIEFHFLDFQMNQTAPAATNLIQNLEIFVNLTFGNHQAFPNGEKLSESGVFTSPIPESPQGYKQLYNGIYNGRAENKISIDQKIALDMCGFSYEKGFMDVWIRPTNGAAAGAFHEGFYTCFFNWNFGNKIVQEMDAPWSNTFQCNSGSLNNYSFRLWYRMRFYNIDANTCQPGLSPK